MNRFEEYALGRPYHAALVDLRDARDPHGHPDFYEVMVVLDGAGWQDRGDGLQSLRPGEVLLVRPGDHHALSSADAAGLRFFNVAFPATAWRSDACLSFRACRGRSTTHRNPIVPIRGLKRTATIMSLLRDNQGDEACLQPQKLAFNGIRFRITGDDIVTNH